MQNRYIYITIMAMLGIYTNASGQEKIQYAPRLVVNITIDQLRTDYLGLSPLFTARMVSKSYLMRDWYTRMPTTPSQAWTEPLPLRQSSLEFLPIITE